MEAKQCVCNDCGCRFEYRILKEGELPVLPEEKKECTPAKTNVACPQCASLNVTTA
jgi:hypothetical protein